MSLSVSCQLFIVKSIEGFGSSGSQSSQWYIFIAFTSWEI